MNVQKNSVRERRKYLELLKKEEKDNHPLEEKWHELLKRPFISQLTLPPIDHRRRRQASAIRRPRSPDRYIAERRWNI